MNKIHQKLLLSFIIGFIVSCSPRISDNISPKGKNNKAFQTTKEERVNKLFNELNSEKSPGASVAIVKDGKIIFSKGYGSANLEYDIPISENTIFHVASVSKQFTAFAIAILADRGKLSLDDNIREHLPKMHDYGKKITIEHLVHHMSGLRDQWELLELAGWRSDDIKTEEQILKLIYNQKELNFEPGNEFQYSNTNYTLLAKIAEAVTGEKFSKWTLENIFTPLGMNHTIFYDDYEKVVVNRAYSYSKNNNGYRKKMLNYSTVGATSLFTTAEDLVLWAQNFETNTLGNQAIMKQMNKTSSLNNGKPTNYAFGQGISTYKGLPLVYHPGADAGYKAYLGRFPNNGLTVIILSNLDSFNPEKVAMQIADIYLEEFIVPQFNLQEYVGNYKIKERFELKVWVDDTILKAQLLGKNDIHNMVFIKGTSFEIPTLGTTLIFSRNPSGQIDGLTMEKDGHSMVAPKVEENKMTNNLSQIKQNKIIISNILLNEYKGKYEIQKHLNLDISIVDNNLKGKITGKKDVHDLIAKTVSEFEVPSLKATITFERDMKGMVKQLSFHSKEGRIMVALKISSNELERISLKEYVGKYYSDELSTFYSFVLEQGKLIVQHQKHNDISLKLLEPDFLVGKSNFFKDVEVVRNTQQEVLGIKVTSGQVKDLWFKKTE